MCHSLESSLAHLAFDKAGLSIWPCLAKLATLTPSDVYTRTHIQTRAQHPRTHIGI
jgi:hypothetical protein